MKIYCWIKSVVTILSPLWTLSFFWFALSRLHMSGDAQTYYNLICHLWLTFLGCLPLG